MARRLKLIGAAHYQNDGDPRTSGPGFRVTFHENSLFDPLLRKKPTMWFVNSMSDLFHRDITNTEIADIFATMAESPHHTYQVLTKRALRMETWLASGKAFTENALTYRSSRVHVDWTFDDALPNVWIGVSIENDYYTVRADALRRAPAAVRFVSAEPLLAPLPSLKLDRIDWLIVGCESIGSKAGRPMQLDWVRDLRDRAGEAGTAFFVKQLPINGRVVKDLERFPADLQIRQYPQVAA
jgi:protein gp37